jgi:uncharacterized delta-60 repeat protein
MKNKNYFKKLVLAVVMLGTFATQAQTAGTVDPSFNPPVNNVAQVGPNGKVYCSVKQMVNGVEKILIGGDFTSYNGVPRKYIARLNADGTLDTNFTGETDKTVRAIAIQSDNKILIGGDFSKVSSVDRMFIARLNANGTLDTNFTVTTDKTVRTIVIQSDNKILIGGDFSKVSSVDRIFIARLYASGSLDHLFNPNIMVENPKSGIIGGVSTIAIQNVNNVDMILIGGGFVAPPKRIARLNSNGTIDTNFNKPADIRVNDDQGTDGYVRTIAIQSDNKILIGGKFKRYNNKYVTDMSAESAGIIRLDADGNHNTSFDRYVNKEISTIAVQPDGEIFIGGVFQDRISKRSWYLDHFSSVTLNGAVHTILFQGDNVIIGGEFTTPKMGIIRIFGKDANLSTSSFDKKSMKIYPNPVRDILNISMVDNMTIEKVTIVDMTGKVVLEQTESLSSVNVDKLANGVYILTATAGGKTFEERYIKE